MIRIYFWKVESNRIPRAVISMALNRIALQRNGAISFWKLLGTGKGETFTPRDADAHRWGLIINIDTEALKDFESSSLIKKWRACATEEFSATLKPIASQGKWSKQTPFLPQIDNDWNGTVAAITRARIKWRKNPLFWRSVPPVTISLRNSPGLISAIGIGEAPIGLQGTFSIWESPAAIKEFAYRGQAHKEVIAATHREKWYSEELFARFAVTEMKGTL
jgi:hypothetical protein